MKHTKLGYLSILLATVISCTHNDDVFEQSPNKEFSSDIESRIQYDEINVLTKGFLGAQGSEQLLVFPDLETFTATVSELDRQVNDFDDAFNEFYRDLDEEAINDKAMEIDFNEELPILEFLNNMGFNSLYHEVANKEEIWLMQEELDFNNDPDDHFIDGDSYRALVNTDGEVQVGASIYKFTPDGHFQIVDGDVETLKLIENLSNERRSLPENVIFVGDEDASDSRINAGDCRSGKSSCGYKYNGKYRLKWKVKIAFRGITSVHKYYAETTNYKKRRLGWFKYKTGCSATVYGYYNCDAKSDLNPGQWYASGVHFKRSIRCEISTKPKTKSGWIKGRHYGAKGITYESTLKW